MNIDESRKKELTGLVNNGTFVSVPQKEVHTGMHILGSRVIDEIMRVRTGMRKKSRLVTRNYQGAVSTRKATKVPTVN